MFRKFVFFMSLMATFFCYLVLTSNEANAGEIESNENQICFAHAGEFSCLKADSFENLLKQINELNLPSGEYLVFIKKEIGWRIKCQFEKNRKIEEVEFVSVGNLPANVQNKLENKNKYYLIRVILN